MSNFIHDLNIDLLMYLIRGIRYTWYMKSSTFELRALLKLE